LTLARALLFAGRDMRVLSIVLLALVLFGARTWAADAPPAAPPQPYDAPVPAAGAAAPPAPAASATVAPLRSPQASDEEAPRAALPQASEEPPVAQRVPIPDHPSEPGRIVAESLLAYLTSGITAGIALTVFITTGPGGFVALLAAPAATGGVVCAIGSGSDYFDGRCGTAVSGAYVGALAAIPMAILFSTRPNNSDLLPPAVSGALLGYVIGTTVGAVVGWNVSRTRKDAPRADAARLDALAAARGAPWREPLLPRGAALEGGGPRLTAPVLAFRF
jgi:hypothetical protein